jgi:cyclopropane-fatty-acyl-phospholipid synthase
VHYDLGNDFYSDMLDKRMQYTCAYWKNAKSLDEAQEHKLDLICKKLQLKKGDTVLELGCGWGGFARYASEKYGCKVTGYNISKEQVRFAREYCKGLPVEIIEADYRDAKGLFDKVVSIGLCEHVGYKNYRNLMQVAHKCLKNKGLFLLHTIGRNTSLKSLEPWMNKYIFPNAMLPSVKQLSIASEGLFLLEDWHNFGRDYDKTLMAWNENFEKNWSKHKSKYGDRFYRMWKYYLLLCAGAFRADYNRLWQIVFSKGGLPGKYDSVR